MTVVSTTPCTRPFGLCLRLTKLAALGFVSLPIEEQARASEIGTEGTKSEQSLTNRRFCQSGALLADPRNCDGLEAKLTTTTGNTCSFWNKRPKVAKYEKY